MSHMLHSTALAENADRTMFIQLHGHHMLSAVKVDLK